jgi:hypothetical protein
MRHTAAMRTSRRESPSMKAGEAASPQSPAQLTCSHCERSLESCAFCDEERCTVGVCCVCVRTALGEWTTQPHPHGG